MLDFNGAEPQRPDGIIPNGTYAPVVMIFKPGNFTMPGFGPEDNGLFKDYSTGSVAVECEFTVTRGPHAGRKFWDRFFVAFGDGETEKASPIFKRTIAAILNSATNTDPKDSSPAAAAKRVIPSILAMNGIEFFSKVGVEEGGVGYEDKNKLDRAVTPDQPEYAILLAGGAPDPKPTKRKAAAKAAAPAAGSWTAPKAPVPAAAAQTQLQWPQQPPATTVLVPFNGPAVPQNPGYAQQVLNDPVDDIGRAPAQPAVPANGPTWLTQ